MEDKDMIRELAAETVFEPGHVPETARNGEKVLEKYQTAYGMRDTLRRGHQGP